MQEGIIVQATSKVPQMQSMDAHIAKVEYKVRFHSSILGLGWTSL
jgi:hypothetical protein